MKHRTKICWRGALFDFGRKSGSEQTLRSGAGQPGDSSTTARPFKIVSRGLFVTAASLKITWWTILARGRWQMHRYDSRAAGAVASLLRDLLPDRAAGVTGQSWRDQQQFVVGA